jgi:UDP-glucose 4-epimerase
MSRIDLVGKNVAVTGGAGLIGSFLVEDLVARGAKVVVVDDFSTGLAAHLAAVRAKIELREGDLEKPGFAHEALAGADVVFHLASRAFGIGYAAARHLEICLHNERITNNMVEALAVHRPQFVLTVSSSCVHRDDGPATFPELPIFDGDPERVNRGYGWAKRFMEMKFTLLSESTGVPVTIARPVNIYGERYRWRGANSQAIPMLVHKALSGMNPLVIWGSGAQRRNYLHASDCAALLRRLVEADAGGRTVNIGLEDTVSMVDLLNTILQVTGLSPQIELDRTKPEGRAVKSADSTLLRALLGDVAPRIGLAEGLQRMAAWFAQLPDADKAPLPRN